MRIAVYMLTAATAVSVPGIVANQMGWRIGDLSNFQSDEAEVVQVAAPQLVTYDEPEEEDAAAEEAPVDEDMLPITARLPGSFTALPPDLATSMRDKILAMRGEAPSETPKKSGGH